jgi:hypothetical protein
MRVASYDTAELYAQLSAAWAEYKEAKARNDVPRMKEITNRINEIQQKLNINTNQSK